MVLLWILLGWAVLAALTAVVFAAVGRAALREDEGLGYTRAAPPAVPPDDAGHETVPSGHPASV